MQGHVHQALALTAFGNDSLRGRHCDIWPQGAAFQFSKRTLFTGGAGPAGAGTEIAADPAAWFAVLKKARVKGLRMHHRRGRSLAEDYNTVAFAGGGGQWLIETLGEAGSEFWRCHSQVTHPKAPDSRIWTDTYYRAGAAYSTLTPYTDIAAARRALLAVLPTAAAFAYAHTEKAEFAPAFEQAATKLEHASPLESGELRDLDRCQALPLEAKQLIAGASAAWVFGGMGWWNDGSFWEPETEAKFRALSDELWTALVNAVLAGANASFGR